VYKWTSYSHILLDNFSQESMFDVNGVFNMRVTARPQPQHARDPTQDFLIDSAILYLNFALPAK